jgi:hypothetical protein
MVVDYLSMSSVDFGAPDFCSPMSEPIGRQAAVDRKLAQIAQRGVHPPGTPLSLEDARRLAEGRVEHYNNVRFLLSHF